MNTKPTFNARDQQVLAAEKEQRRRAYWRAHDKIKTQVIAEMVKKGWKPQ